MEDIPNFKFKGLKISIECEEFEASGFNGQRINEILNRLSELETHRQKTWDAAEKVSSGLDSILNKLDKK